MLGRDATVDFNANVDQYNQSLTQAIAITNQYAKAADGMIGKVANLGGTISNTLIQKTTALTQANKTAVAQAAAYQQQLSKIETTSKVLGDKNFPALEKATKSLATSFPIGIGQAVQQMESLQESGITNLKTAEKLAVSYTKLGAATGSYGPQVGQQMTALTRSMGNSMNMVDGMSDSLTTLTKKYGGTAEGILAFSKSISPIAAQMGISQTQVMGLSTAFARLDEDGFAAGNALNKVLLDLNRSVRDGTPELREYAQVMNKSVESLRAQVTNDPTSVLVDFTKAINSMGPDAIRTLESLGLEGVRTTKALTSLSREGNLGQIIEDASNAFGNDATARGAEAAMGGVNDQIAKLNETMAQSAAAAGKPFLGMLEGVLKVSNNIAGTFNDIVNSGAVQTMGGVGQVAGGLVGGAGSLALGAVNTALTVSMGRKALGWAGNRYEEFKAGRMAGTAANLQAAGRGDLIPADFMVSDKQTGSYFGRMGQNLAEAGGFMDAASLLPGGGGFAGTTRQRLGTVGRGAWNLGKNTGVLAMMAAGSDIGSTVGYNKMSSELSGEFRTAAGVAKDLSARGDFKGARDALLPAMHKLAKEMADNGEAFGSLRGAAGDLTRRTGELYKTTAGQMLGGAGRGLMGLAGGPAGIAMMAGTAAVGLGSAWYQHQKESAAAVQTAGDSPFQAFNEFAEKAGIAARQVSALGEASEASTKTILAEENVRSGDWAKISSRESTLASSQDYQAAFKTGNSAADDALKFYLSNPKASEEAKSRWMADLINQGGTTYAETGAAELQNLGGKKIEDVWSEAFQGTSDLPATVGEKTIRSGFAAFTPAAWPLAALNKIPAVGNATGDILNRFGLNFDTKAETERKADIRASMEQERISNEEQGGAQYANVKQLEQVEKLYNDSKEWSSKERDAAMDVIADLTGVNRRDLSPTTKSFEDAMSTLQGKEGALQTRTLETWGLAQKSDSGALKSTYAVDENLKAAEKSQGLTSQLIGVTVDLTDAMYEGSKRSKELNKGIGDLNEQDLSGMTNLQRLVTQSQMQPGDVGKAAQAGTALAGEAFKQTGSGWKSEFALQQYLSTARTEEKPAIQAALQMINLNPDVVQQRAKASPLEGLQNRMQAGTAASQQMANLPANADPGIVQMNVQKMADASAAYQEYTGIIRQTYTQVRDTLIQWDRQETQFGVSQARSRRDFNRQQSWAEDDYHRQRRHARRDFNRQMNWQEDDYELSRKRAREDFNKARSRQQEDFHRSMARATEQFERSITRSREDFAKQRARSEEQFNLSRARAFADHDKALKRQIEDSAKDMYDPYTRVLHERVWDTKQLLGNMREQNAMIAKQMSQVDDLKKMGLSQQAVDVFGLADPQKAQQLFKTYGEILNDPKLIEQLNSSVQGRMDLAKAFTTDTDNVGFRRQEEDFSESMKRASEDFATQQKHATEDFATSMARSQEDFRISMKQSAEDQALSLKRGMEDFALSMRRGADDFKTNTERATKSFNTSMSDSAEQFKISAGRNNKQFRTAMSDARADLATARSNMLADMQRTLRDLSTDYDGILGEAEKQIAKLPGDVRDDLLKALGKVEKDYEAEVASWETKPKPIEVDVRLKYDKKWTEEHLDEWGEIVVTPKDAAKAGKGGGGTPREDDEDVDPGSGGSITRWTGGKGSPGAGWYKKGNWTWAGGHHNGVDIVGVGTGTPVNTTRGGRIVHVGRGGPEGGWAGINVIQDVGDVQLVFAHLSSTSTSSGRREGPGAVIGRTGETGRAFGAHLHVSARKGGTYVDPRKYLAEGAIAKSPLDAKVGEAGYPEAILPLNARGADFLRQLIDHYIPHDEARQARVSPYATNVTITSNVIYDQSVKVMGPVSVEADSPQDFARAMEAKQRRDRLVQPVGSRR